MNKNKAKRVYLLTYSQANLIDFPTRQSFAEACKDAFQEGACEVIQYACSREKHSDGEGEHYHMCLKLNIPKRWFTPRENLFRWFGIHVDITELDKEGDFYAYAYRYICKSDKEVYHSPKHPNLEQVHSPRTKKSLKAYLENTRKRKSTVAEATSTKKQKVQRSNNSGGRVTQLEAGNWAVTTKIKTEQQFYVEAQRRRKDGLSDMADFVMRNSQNIQRIIDTAWKLENALEKAEQDVVPRMTRIRKLTSTDCPEQCSGKWLTLALETLKKNNINKYIFAASMRELLEKGRGKHRNIVIVGPADTGKTFLLNPISKVFDRSFVNPSSTRFAWIVADEAEVIFLNDYRWNSSQITWHDLLRLLEEGQIVHLPAPMNNYSKEIVIDSDVAIFATSNAEIKLYGRNNELIRDETDMMSVRWKVFTLHQSIPTIDQVNVPPCPVCFSKLVLFGEETD